jgi:hypothetical protein
VRFNFFTPCRSDETSARLKDKINKLDPFSIESQVSAKINDQRLAILLTQIPGRGGESEFLVPGNCSHELWPLFYSTFFARLRRRRLTNKTTSG